MRVRVSQSDSRHEQASASWSSGKVHRPSYTLKLVLPRANFTTCCNRRWLVVSFRCLCKHQSCQRTVESFRILKQQNDRPQHHVAIWLFVLLDLESPFLNVELAEVAPNQQPVRKKQRIRVDNTLRTRTSCSSVRATGSLHCIRRLSNPIDLALFCCCLKLMLLLSYLFSSLL